MFRVANSLSTKFPRILAHALKGRASRLSSPIYNNRYFLDAQRPFSTSLRSNDDMTVMSLTNIGGALAEEHIPIPTAGKNEVVVKVTSCAVCHRDLLDRQGAFPFMKLPVVPGHEISGIVVSKGKNVQHLNVGQKVVSLHWAPCLKCKSCQKALQSRAISENAFLDKHVYYNCTKSKGSFLGITIDGGYSQYVKNNASGFVPVPSNAFSSVEAAPIMCTFGTVWRAAITKGKLQEGEHVLVTGATGGVGSAMIQIAKAMNCTVTAVTSNEAKVSYLKELGSDNVIVTSNADEIDFTKDLDMKNKPTMVFECVGGPTFPASLRSLRSGGRLVLIGNVTVATVKLPLGYLIINGIDIIGSDSCSGEELLEAMEFMSKHKIRPQIAQVMPLDEALEAQRLLHDKSVCGRIVLDIDADEWSDGSKVI